MPDHRADNLFRGRRIMATMDRTFFIGLLIVASFIGIHIRHANASIEQYRIACLSESETLTGQDQMMVDHADIAFNTPAALPTKRCYVRFMTTPRCVSPRLKGNYSYLATYPGLNSGKICLFNNEMDSQFINNLSTTKFSNVPYSNWSDAAEHLDALK